MRRKNIEPQAMLDSLPDDINTPVMREAVCAWYNAKREIGKPITPTAWTRQLNILVAFGHDKAVAAINHSIAGGYQGIFPAPEQRTAQARTDATQSKAPSFWELTKRLELKETKMRELATLYRFDYPANKRTHPDKWAEFQDLKTESQNLRNRLAAAVE